MFDADWGEGAVLVLDELQAATRAALDAVGPRVVTAMMLLEAVRWARQWGLEDEAVVLRGVQVDLRGREQELIVAHVEAGWPAIAAALGVSEGRVRALYAAAVRDAAAPPPGRRPRPGRGATSA